MTRNDTTKLALDQLGADECNVLFHDAVRPLVNQRIVRECVNALRTYEAVDVAIPSADTIIVVDDGVISDIPDRGRLRRGQTPQGFRLSTIRRAYELAWQDPDFAATDDCSVVLKYLPEVADPRGRGLRAQHEGHRSGRPVHRRQAVPAQLLDGRAARRARRSTPSCSVAGSPSSSAGATASAARWRRCSRGTARQVFSFSRSTTNTHVEDPRDVEAALGKVHGETGRIDYIVVTAGVLDDRSARRRPTTRRSPR